MNDVVPGVMRCAKCKFHLIRTTLYLRSGNAGLGNNDTEPCPNGCGPLWPQTWKQEATELGERLEAMFTELVALKAAVRDMAGALKVAKEIENAFFEFDDSPKDALATMGEIYGRWSDSFADRLAKHAALIEAEGE